MLSELLRDQRYTDKNRLSNELMSDSQMRVASRTRDLILNMRTLYEIFGCITRLHYKFGNKQLYVIKRIAKLLENPDDYNFKGGSKYMLYRNREWSSDLPSDPEIIVAIFCHLMDDAYFSSKSQKQVLSNPVCHLLELIQIQSIPYIPDD